MATVGDVVVAARESGLVQVYTLPRGTIECKFNIGVRPYKIALNCTASRMSVIDIAGLLPFLNAVFVVIVLIGVVSSE